MLEIEQSRIGRYKILNNRDEKYLLDVDFTNPISMLFESPANRELFGILIDENIYQKLKGKIQGQVGVLPAVLITQPLVGIVYRLGQEVMGKVNGNSTLVFKIISIIFTILVSVVVKKILSWNDSRILKKYMLNKEKVSIVVYMNKGVKQFHKTFLTDSWLLILLIAVIPLFLYFKLNDGGEIAFYFVFSLAFFSFLIMSRYPLQSTIYKNYNVRIKN